MRSSGSASPNSRRGPARPSKQGVDIASTPPEPRGGRKGTEPATETDALSAAIALIAADDPGEIPRALAGRWSDGRRFDLCYFLGVWREAEGDLVTARVLLDRAIALQVTRALHYPRAAALRRRLGA